jgi:hypothetical protein
MKLHFNPGQWQAPGRGGFHDRQGRDASRLTVKIYPGVRRPGSTGHSSHWDLRVSATAPWREPALLIKWCDIYRETGVIMVIS